MWHALVETEGACVSPTSLRDSQAGIKLLRAFRNPWQFVQWCFADAACAGD